MYFTITIYGDRHGEEKLYESDIQSVSRLDDVGTTATEIVAGQLDPCSKCGVLIPHDNELLCRDCADHMDRQNDPELYQYN